MFNNNSDFIYCKNNGLSKEKCDLIIDLFEKEEDASEGLIGSDDGRVDEKIKKCVEVYNNVSEENEYNEFFYMN